MNEHIKTTFIVAMLIVAVSTAVMSTSANHDRMVEISAERYEECIIEQTHKTPSEYYNTYGVYPMCLK